MFCIQIADLIVQIDHDYDEVKKRSRDYIIQPEREPDLTIRADKEYLKFSRKWFEDEGTLHTFEDPEGYVEFDSLSHALYPRLSSFDALWLHAAVVEVGGQGFAFTAPSGYGKTTQTRLWMQEFGDQLRVINGDNPILRRKNGVFHAYGTPFCGKESWSVNTGVPLRAICFLEHSDETQAERMPQHMAFAKLMRDANALINKSSSSVEVLSLCQQVAQEVPVYTLRCTLSPDAARLAYESILNG